MRSFLSGVRRRTDLSAGIPSTAVGNKTSLPMPPLEMRKLVGPTEEALFDNPSQGPVIPGLEAQHYRSVLDFGCGCGRIARQLIQQRPRPERYLGLDLHPGMIRWCKEHLAHHAPGFAFAHHDVFYEAFNPGPNKPLWAPFPVGANEFTLVLALSVFTHLTEDQAGRYLNEIARVLTPDGVFVSTWFLFDKRDFPMMQDEQNTLFINGYDIRNAVIYDRGWLSRALQAAGLTIYEVEPPAIRGFQWRLRMTTREGVRAVEIPEDRAGPGRQPPPAMPAQASQIGLG